MKPINLRIAQELGVREEQVTAAVSLLDGGATVPFVARYRKEATSDLGLPAPPPRAARPAVPGSGRDPMTILVLSRRYPFAGTSRSRRRTRFTPAPANAVRASPTSPRSGRRARQQPSIRGQNRLCAFGDPNKTIPR